MTPQIVVESTVRVALVLAVGLSALRLLRSRSAALRHWVLSVTILVAAVAPAAPGLLPIGSVGFDRITGLLSPTGGPATAGPQAVETTTFRLPETTGATGSPGGSTAGSSIMRGLVLVWAAGAVIFLLLLATGLARLCWLAARSRRLTDGCCRAIAGELARHAGLRRPVRVLESDHPTLLVTWGLLRPTIVLPRSTAIWPEPRLRIVLAHEIAHIARGDWPVQMLAEIVRAAYWFNPLAWLACRRLRHESERAADDTVLRMGIDGYEYATELVTLARELARGRQPAFPALAMARRSGFERRVSAVMNTQLDHTAGSWRSRLATAGLMLALIGPIVIAAPVSNDVASIQSTLSGIVVDPMGRPMPGVRILATRAADDTSRETHSDGQGRFVFPDLPTGDYRLAASMPGFKTGVLTGVVVGQEPVTTRFMMEVGALAETINVRSTMQAVAAGGGEPRAAAARALVPTRPCVSDGSGGDIKEPRKIRDVRPSYPAHLVSEEVTGIVILEGVVSTDGSVTGIQVRRDPHPDLAEAAIGAVSQWVFMPTLLNCEPVEVVITVTINFTVER